MVACLVIAGVSTVGSSLLWRSLPIAMSDSSEPLSVPLFSDIAIGSRWADVLPTDLDAGLVVTGNLPFLIRGELLLCCWCSCCFVDFEESVRRAPSRISCTCSSSSSLLSICGAKSSSQVKTWATSPDSLPTTLTVTSRLTWVVTVVITRVCVICLYCTSFRARFDRSTDTSLSDDSPLSWRPRLPNNPSCKEVGFDVSFSSLRSSTDWSLDKLGSSTIRQVDASRVLVLPSSWTSFLDQISAFPRVPRGDPLLGFFLTGSGASSSAVHANGSLSLSTSLFLLLAMASRAWLNIDRGRSGALGWRRSELPGVVEIGGSAGSKWKTGSELSESLSGEPWRGIDTVRDWGLIWSKQPNGATKKRKMHKRVVKIYEQQKPARHAFLGDSTTQKGDLKEPFSWV